MLTCKKNKKINGQTARQPREFPAVELWNQEWGSGGLVGTLKSCKDPPPKKRGWCHAGSKIWAQSVKVKTTFVEKKKREICAITQWNDSASKVLQGAVKECFGWRLVQAPPTFNRCSRELQKPGGWLFTVENSVRTHKTFPPPRNWYSVQKQAAARTDEATRQLSDTTETCEIQNQNQEKNRRPRLGKIAGGRGGGGFGGDPTLLNEAKRWPSISHEKLQQLRCWDAHLP